MQISANRHTKEQVKLVHNWLIRAGESVNNDQFVHVFSSDAPPIGWHLWHMARFADRLQAKLTQVTDGFASDEIWQREGVPARWNLTPGRLGVFDSGMGQTHRDAQATIAQVGQNEILAYAKSAFDASSQTLERLTDADFEKTYHGILDYGYDGTTGKVWATEPKESIVAQDLVFHASHGSRHMGMMEALRGLLGTAGTLSV
ncbi:MAG TPA: DinB family protein [Caldilineaceae bacterium]|nr:DinB family protein [Caldilineaceae bacterium]